MTGTRSELGSPPINSDTKVDARTISSVVTPKILHELLISITIVTASIYLLGS